MTTDELLATVSSAEETQALAAAIASVVRAGDMVLLAGDLGAGKTTFTQGFGRALGVTDRITSPTFTLVNHYPGREVMLVHADVYRLDRLQEIIDLGLSELVDGEDDAAVAVVEWGDVAEPVLPKDFLEITIAYPEGGETDTGRSFSLRPVGGSWLARAGDLRRSLEPWCDQP